MTQPRRLTELQTPKRNDGRRNATSPGLNQSREGASPRLVSATRFFCPALQPMKRPPVIQAGTLLCCVASSSCWGVGRVDVGRGRDRFRRSQPQQRDVYVRGAWA